MGLKSKILLFLFFMLPIGWFYVSVTLGKYDSKAQEFYQQLESTQQLELIEEKKVA